MRVVRAIPVTQVVYDRLPLNPTGLATTQALADGVEMPPIHVEVLPNGRYKVRDGRHRLLAHKLLGKTHILARFWDWRGAKI